MRMDQNGKPAWIGEMFEQKIAKNGGVVRRSKKSVEVYFRDAEGNNNFECLKIAVAEKGFFMMEMANQYVIICQTGVIEIKTHR